METCNKIPKYMVNKKIRFTSSHRCKLIKLWKHDRDKQKTMLYSNDAEKDSFQNDVIKSLQSPSEEKRFTQMVKIFYCICFQLIQIWLNFMIFPSSKSCKRVDFLVAIIL